MGQKVHPKGIRLGISSDWVSKWYADSATYPLYVHQDQVEVLLFAGFYGLGPVLGDMNRVAGIF